jgi:hypothetical protein
MSVCLLLTVRTLSVEEYVDLPVFGIRAADNDFNHKLMRPRFWDFRVPYGDLGAFADNRFLHGRFELLHGQLICDAILSLFRD